MGCGASINTVLRDVDEAYWELVRSIKLLQIIHEQRQVLEDLVKRAQQLFEAQSITACDQVQFEADLEDIKNQTEIAWNSLITSSNRLEPISKPRFSPLCMRVWEGLEIGS